ncbi:MAG TPA: hypothetical protein VFN88_00770 [Caulobacteraceae bacterium]|nr:hypothetical protein [Caulobacteraceae bacterium]
MSDKKLYQLPALTGPGAGDLVYVSKADGSADGAASFSSLTPVLGGVLAGAFAPASHGHALADIAGAGALSTYAAIAPSADVQSLLGAASDAAIRSQLGLALGADVQAYSPALGVYAAISPSTDVQTLLGAADYPAFRSCSGLAIGADVQGYSARLADLAGASWTQGDLAYFDGSNLTRLAAGTSGQFLKTQGAAANPVWDTPAGSGTIGGSSGSTDKAIIRADGTGGATIKGGSLITISDTGALGLPDGVRQVFNPDATSAGLNVGAQAGDPSSLSNGDVWYDSTANSLKGRISGVTVGLAARALIEETVTSGSQTTVTFSSIPAIFRDLEVVVRGRSAQAVLGSDILMRFNNDSGTNYQYEQAAFSGTATAFAQSTGQTSQKVSIFPGISAVTSYAGSATIRILDYRGTTFFKNTQIQSGGNYGTTTNTNQILLYQGLWLSTSAINRVDVFTASSNFVDGSIVSLYGLM